MNQILFPMFFDHTFVAISKHTDYLKEKILTKCEELFLRYGIKSLTMDDIARELGISKKTLYKAVDNKADLIRQTIYSSVLNEKRDIENILENSSNPIEELLNIARHFMEMLRKMSPNTVYDLKKYYRESWEILEQLHVKHMTGVILDNIRKGIQLNLYRQDVNPEVIARLYAATGSLIVDDQLFPPQRFNRDELFWEYINYHIHGIASEKGLKLLKGINI